MDTESLQILTNGQVAIPSLKDPNNSFFFSDGDSINAIYSGKDVSCKKQSVQKLHIFMPIINIFTGHAIYQTVIFQWTSNF